MKPFWLYSRQGVRDRLDLVVQARPELLNAADNETRYKPSEQAVLDGAIATVVTQKPPQGAHTRQLRSRILEEG